jgi:CBS domain-containing protein
VKQNVPITSIMTTQPKTAHLGQPLSEIRAMMAEGGFHVVPVVNGKKLVGLITVVDLLKVTYAYDTDQRMVDAVLDSTVNLGELMQKYPVTLKIGNSVRNAVQIFAEGKFHSLPVVDNDDNLVGIVTTTDVIRYVLEQY